MRQGQEIILMVVFSFFGLFGVQGCRQREADLTIDRQDSVTQLASSIVSEFMLIENNSANLKIAPEGLQQKNGELSLVVSNLERADFERLDEIVVRIVSSGEFSGRVQVRFLVRLRLAETDFVEEEIKIYSARPKFRLPDDLQRSL
jgi:hypothetical protein